jgi:hypothetical protein
MFEIKQMRVSDARCSSEALSVHELVYAEAAFLEAKKDLFEINRVFK